MPDALRIKLTKDEITAIRTAAPFNPLFPMNFLYCFRGDQDYSLDLTAQQNQQYQMAAWIDAPPKPQVRFCRVCRCFLSTLILTGQAWSKNFY